MKVSLFTTCLIDQFYPQVGVATVRVLEKLGVEVEYDSRQTCCAQPGFNAGYLKEAAPVARHFLEVFGDVERIVVPSGSCCTMLRHFVPGLFPEGSPEHEVACGLAERVWEFSDFLVSVLKVEETGARFDQAVVYHDSCHLLRELGIRDQPRRLMAKVSGIDLRELDDQQRCCGFGGLFSVKFPEISTAVGQDKLEAIRRSGARWVVANDVSCLMHLEGMIRRQGLDIGTMHIAELLAKD